MAMRPSRPSARCAQLLSFVASLACQGCELIAPLDPFSSNEPDASDDRSDRPDVADLADRAEDAADESSHPPPLPLPNNYPPYSSRTPFPSTPILNDFNNSLDQWINKNKGAFSIQTGQLITTKNVSLYWSQKFGA